MERRDWKNLINAIQQQRCVLMLGPALASAEYEGKTLPINEIFSLQLCKELDAEGVDYDHAHRHNLTYIAQKYLTIDGMRRVDLEEEIKTAYAQYVKDIPPIFYELAKYPFHLIINTNVDDFMVRALQQAGKHHCTHSWYNFRKDSMTKVGEISDSAPLVYNLFGSFKDPEALVLTAEDQVGFMKNIVRDEPPIPARIMSHFDNRKTYLFFEFDLRNWHFRLLLEGLNLQRENRSFSPKFSKGEFGALTKAFYENRFSFKFIDKKIVDFSNELTEKFQSAQTQETATTTKTQHIYIASAPEDGNNYLDPLVKALKPLEDNKRITIWHSGMVLPGQNPEAEKAKHIENTDIFLFLLSADLLASTAIMHHEVQPAFARQAEGKARVIPVLARSCNWEETQFAPLPMLPDNKKPMNDIAYWKSMDFALKNIVKGVQRI